MAQTRRRRWPQFSLRRFFAVITLAAVLCCYFSIPTMRAQRFISAIQSGHYDVAKAMCPTLQHSRRFSDDWGMRNANIRLVSPGLRDIFYGERQVLVSGAASFYIFRVTLTGIRSEGGIED